MSPEGQEVIHAISLPEEFLVDLGLLEHPEIELGLRSRSADAVVSLAEVSVQVVGMLANMTTILTSQEQILETIRMFYNWARRRDAPDASKCRVVYRGQKVEFDLHATSESDAELQALLLAVASALADTALERE